MGSHGKNGQNIESLRQQLLMHAGQECRIMVAAYRAVFLTEEQMREEYTITTPYFLPAQITRDSERDQYRKMIRLAAGSYEAFLAKAGALFSIDPEHLASPDDENPASYNEHAIACDGIARECLRKARVQSIALAHPRHEHDAPQEYADARLAIVAPVTTGIRFVG